jgi:mRNA interferase HicA
LKLTDLLRHLQANDCRLLREGGNHSIYINDRSGKRASVPRHRELKKTTALKICRQLEVPDPF